MDLRSSLPMPLIHFSTQSMTSEFYFQQDKTATILNNCCLGIWTLFRTATLTETVQQEFWFMGGGRMKPVISAQQLPLNFWITTTSTLFSLIGPKVLKPLIILAPLIVYQELDKWSQIIWTSFNHMVLSILIGSQSSDSVLAHTLLAWLERMFAMVVLTISLV